MSGKGAHEGRPYVRLGGGRGWIPASVFTRAGLRGNDGGRESEGGRAKDGSPHPRGQREEMEGVGFWLGVEDVVGEDSASESGE